MSEKEIKNEMEVICPGIDPEQPFVLEIWGTMASIKLEVPPIKAPSEKGQESGSEVKPPEANETISETVPKPVEEQVKCDAGCIFEGKCVLQGTRLELDGSQVYCSYTGEFLLQKEVGASCNNDYECETNSCISGKCQDISKELSKTRERLNVIETLLQRLFGLFKIFGF